MCAHTAPPSLPYYASPLVGREAELELLQGLIADPYVHLITVTGTAGIGKTRLAVNVAGEQSSGNTLFVPLAAIHDPGLIPMEIGKMLEIHGDDLISRIRDRLADWEGMVVLDNFEQVIDAAADIASILPHNDSFTLLITSQRPLYIDGEHVVRLEPFALPDEDADLDTLRSSPSMQLMTHRLRSQDATIDHELDDESTTRAIGEICRRLDGIPLALELAAPRLASLSPEVVLDQLERGQDILSSRRRDIPARQRTMHSAISWSVQQLPDDIRQVFLWLGPFTGGFDLDIAEKLSAHLKVDTPAFDIVSELMSLSLIRRMSGGANPWYAMLRSIREFCLAELDAMAERANAESYVSGYVIGFAREMKADLSNKGFSGLTANLERELPTIRSSVQWALSHDDPLPPLVAATSIQNVFREFGGWRELVGWVDAALALPTTAPPDIVIDGLLTKLALQEEAREREGAAATDAQIQGLLEANPDPILEMRYLVISGSIAINENDWPSAEQRFERVLKLATAKNVDRAKNAALSNLGLVAYYQGDYPRAQNYLERAKQLFDETGSLSYQDRILSSLAAVSNAQGNYPQSVSYLNEALDIEDQLGLQLSRIYTLLTLSTAHIGMNNLDEALIAAEEAIDISRELGHQFLEMIGYTRLGTIALARDDISNVYENIQKVLKLQTLMEDAPEYVSLGLLSAGALAAETRYRESAAMLGKTQSLIDELHHQFERQEKELLSRIMDQLQANLPDLDDHLKTGESWSMEAFKRSMNWAARRFNGKSAGILVTVPGHSPGVLPSLTRRENEILHLLTDGRTTRDIAAQLHLSPRTVTTHIGNMMAKLNVHSRTELVATTLRGKT